MEEANCTSTPMDKSHQAGEEINVKITAAPYREAVGSLMYLAVCTRPDITYAVNYVSQFLEKPKERHWTMIKRIMRYIKGSLTLGIYYDATAKGGNLEVFSDADYASDQHTRRSVSGLVCKYSGGAIIWASRRQKRVSLSTTEAEYIAASEAAKDAIWLSQLHNKIAPLTTVPILRVDNVSAIKLTKNPSFHKRTKHIDVRFHYVRERVQEQQLKIEYVPSEEQAADILTKPIPRVQFEKLRRMLGMINI